MAQSFRLEPVPCSNCLPARCCLYTSLQVEGPRSKRDFDDMLWHISHEAIEYYVEDGKWYMLIRSRCSHLGADNRCTIYEHRFRVCREHPTDRCEYHGEYGFEHHFRTFEDLKAYAEDRWAKNRRSLAAARRLNGRSRNGKHREPGHRGPATDRAR